MSVIIALNTSSNVEIVDYSGDVAPYVMESKSRGVMSLLVVDTIGRALVQINTQNKIIPVHFEISHGIRKGPPNHLQGGTPAPKTSASSGLLEQIYPDKVDPFRFLRREEFHNFPGMHVLQGWDRNTQQGFVTLGLIACEPLGSAAYSECLAAATQFAEV